MQLKLVWNQKPPKGNIIVAPPVNISHRLQGEGGKHAWPDLMKEVEDVGHNLAELSSVVTAKNAKLTNADQARAAVLWHSRLEVALISKICAAPKVQPEQVKEQETAMRAQLAEVIAIKLIELADVADISDDGEEVISASWGGHLMSEALRKIRCKVWRAQQLEASTKQKAAKANKDGTSLVHKLSLIHI